jgi:hypothetical protein
MIERIVVFFSKCLVNLFNLCARYVHRKTICIGYAPYLDVFQAIFEVNMGHSFLETNVLCMCGL